MTHPEAVKMAEDLIEMIEELPEDTHVKRSDFFDDVKEKAQEVLRTMERTGRVSGGQENALINWTDGV